MCLKNTIQGEKNMHILRGFIYCSTPNLKCPFPGKIYSSESEWLYDNRIKSMNNETIFNHNEIGFSFLDGFIFNKSDFSLGTDWEKYYISNADNINFINSLRGSFIGILRRNSCYSLWCDQTGNRSLFYYLKNNIIIISSRLDFILQTLKNNNITLEINDEAIEYLAEFGFIQSNITIISSAFRVLPGEKISIKNNRIYRNKYFTLGNCDPIHINRKEAINLIDFYFNQAIYREYQYDLKSSSKHLVDLSGGLDSRMTMLVAYSQGFTNQTNICISPNNHLDYFISKQISEHFKTEYKYYDSNNCIWLNYIDYILSLTNYCSSFYPCGQLLNFYCNERHIGQIKHTGVLGDIILSSLYPSYEVSSSPPKTKETPYTKKISFEHDEYKKYISKESFVLNTTGLLGIQSQNGIIQNFGECYSPFLDVDFCNFVLSIPFEFRKKHSIYIEWINSYYPEATIFGYERWNGMPPTIINYNSILKNSIPQSTTNPKIYTLQLLTQLSSIYTSIKPEVDHIINSFPQYMYLTTLFTNGNITEKSLSLSALLILKKVLS